jgi:hypothetical protein
MTTRIRKRDVDVSARASGRSIDYEKIFESRFVSIENRIAALENSKRDNMIEHGNMHVRDDLDAFEDFGLPSGASAFGRRPPTPIPVFTLTKVDEAAEFEDEEIERPPISVTTFAEEMERDEQMLRDGDAIVTAEAATTIFEPAAGDETPPPLPSPDLSNKLVRELMAMAAELNIENPPKKKSDLVEAVRNALQQKCLDEL